MSNVLLLVLFLPGFSQRSLRGVGWSGATSLHGVQSVTGVLRHVVVGACLLNSGGSVPNKDGAL